MDASLSDAVVDASEDDASVDAAFPISLVCERICNLLPGCAPMMGGDSGAGGGGTPDASDETGVSVAECTMGCEADLIDCSPEQLSALHACGDLMCVSADDFAALIACVTAVECVDMDTMMGPPSV